jgi:hypothetical protein
MSALPPKADIAERYCHVRFVPLTEVDWIAISSPHLLAYFAQRAAAGIYGSYRIDSEVAFHLEPFPRFIRSRS